MGMWIVAGMVTFVVAAVLAAMAYLPGRTGRKPRGGRKAALLGIAAAVGFGFVAAVVKELSAHLSQGPAGVLLNWSPYVLLVSGAAAMFLASNAFHAGSLAASQPGLTIVDPLVAAALGVVLFGESLYHNPLVLCGEILSVATVVASVVILSRSPLVQDEHAAGDGPGEPDLTQRDNAMEFEAVGTRARRPASPGVESWIRGSHATAPSAGEAAWRHHEGRVSTRSRPCGRRAGSATD